MQRIWAALAFLLILFLDQASKYYIQSHWSLGESQATFLPGVYLTYHLNSGAAFGILQGQSTLLMLAAFVFVLAALVYLSRQAKTGAVLTLSWLGLGFVTMGALGNLIDRWRLGHVIDFLDLQFWPIFNVADSAITVGVVMILIHKICAKEQTS